MATNLSASNRSMQLTAQMLLLATPSDKPLRRPGMMSALTARRPDRRYRRGRRGTCRGGDGRNI